MNHNIGVVIAIWAPIVMVSSLESYWYIFLFFYENDWKSVTFFRFISWMHKSGMRYLLPLLVELKEPSATWARLEHNVQYFYCVKKGICKPFIFLAQLFWLDILFCQLFIRFGHLACCVPVLIQFLQPSVNALYLCRKMNL